MRRQRDSRVVLLRLFLMALGLLGFIGHAFAPIFSMALQPDGKILVGGWVCFGGQCNLARLNPDGTLDSGFAPRLAGRGDPEIEVYALGVQPDGKILVSGAFTLLNGQPWTNFARLNPDGTRDTSFTPNS